MYIKTNETSYRCISYKTGPDFARFVLSGACPKTPGDSVELWAEDGFLMAVQTVSDWLRWDIAGGILLLTNVSESAIIPEPDPEPQLPTELEQLRADVDYLSVMTGVMLV